MKRKTYMLTLRFSEPCDGSEVYACSLTDKEAKTLNDAIAWLEKHAGQEWGGCLGAWELFPSKAKGGDLIGLDAVLDDFILNSRYAETDKRGDFYNATYPLFDEYLDRQKQAK